MEWIGNLFQRVFGKRNPATSFAAWGVVVLLFGDAFVTFVCQAEAIDLFGKAVCGTATNLNEKLGIALGIVGIRRRLPSG